MISNRMKNKYTLKRKRHILRKKEHVGEKYLADFSGNRKFLSVISVLVLVTAIRQTSAAQDLGGFHVETLPGESTGIPSDWEVGDGDQDLGNNSSLRKMDMRICLGQEKKAGRGRFMKSRKLCPKAGTCLTGKTAWKIWKKQMRNTWRK